MPIIPQRLMLVLALSLLVPSHVATSLSTQRIAQIAPAVLRVDADSCGSTSRRGTGFHWGSPDLVVTAWHLVSDCNAIQVYSETTKDFYPARVQAILASRDLALLRLSKPIPQTYELRASAQRPDLSEELTVLGYPENIPSLRGNTFHAAYGGRMLRDAVPSNVTAELQRSGFLNPDTDILNIDGHLLPGHSGGPILNSTGEVVAIADGGLEGGAVGVSWALPVSYLPELLRSREQPNQTQRAKSAFLFSYEFQAQHSLITAPQITCNGFGFRLVRKIGFADLLRFADDPQGLMQLLNGTGADFSQFQFDVYQESSSGAAFVLPAGAVPQPQPDSCIVASPSARVWFLITMARYANTMQLEGLVGQYEAKAMYYPPWQYDPGWSYPSPLIRFDGFGVRRKSFVHTLQWPNGLYGPDARTFETLATRNGTLLMVSTLNRQWNPYLIAQGHQACMTLPGSDLCVAYREWASAVISVHLATFPVG